MASSPSASRRRLTAILWNASPLGENLGFEKVKTELQKRPRVELLRALEEAGNLAVLGIGGRPEPESPRGGRSLSFDDSTPCSQAIRPAPHAGVPESSSVARPTPIQSRAARDGSIRARRPNSPARRYPRGRRASIDSPRLALIVGRLGNGDRAGERAPVRAALRPRRAGPRRCRRSRHSISAH